MNRIRPNLWISAWPAATGNLSHYGITAVVNVAFDCNDPNFDPHLIRAVKFHLTDGPNNPAYLIESCVSTICSMLHAGECVLVHCISGISRSPHILALVVARCEDVSYVDAYAEIRRARPEVLKKSRLCTTPDRSESLLH